MEAIFQIKQTKEIHLSRWFKINPILHNISREKFREETMTDKATQDQDFYFLINNFSIRTMIETDSEKKFSGYFLRLPADELSLQRWNIIEKSRHIKKYLNKPEKKPKFDIAFFDKGNIWLYYRFEDYIKIHDEQEFKVLCNQLKDTARKTGKTLKCIIPTNASDLFYLNIQSFDRFGLGNILM